jgi:hypothetical protein
VLQDGWLRFHMLDVSQPPKYEANLYLGFDSATGDYVAHWLDGFGAGGARVVGLGRRVGSTLVMEFPYPGSLFRDTLTISPDGKRGTLLIEAQRADGGWTVFADYALERKSAAATK